MKKNFLFTVTLLALSGLMLAACTGGSAAASPSGEWILVSYGDASSPTTALSNVDTSVNFNEDGTFGGNVGCNSFGADYKVDGDHITFGSIVSTMMFCEETSTQESAVLSILTDKTLSYQFNGNQLTLTSQDGALIVVLARK